MQWTSYDLTEVLSYCKKAPFRSEGCALGKCTTGKKTNGRTEKKRRKLWWWSRMCNILPGGTTIIGCAVQSYSPRVGRWCTRIFVGNEVVLCARECRCGGCPGERRWIVVSCCRVSQQITGCGRSRGRLRDEKNTHQVTLKAKSELGGGCDPSLSASQQTFFCFSLSRITTAPAARPIFSDFDQPVGLGSCYLESSIPGYYYVVPRNWASCTSLYVFRGVGAP